MLKPDVSSAPSRRDMLALALSLGGAATLGAASTLAPVAARAAELPNVGAWKLVSFEVTSGPEKGKPRFGADPAGYLIYTASGKMSAVLTGLRRPMLEAPGPGSTAARGAQCAQSVGDFLAYAGSYEVRGDHVFHHIEASIFTNLIGTTVERQFKIDGDTLTIRTLPPEIWGSGNLLVWKRA